ncbi:F-box domain-containing protein [Favolaschia claudopus]|uniref:F-box domain-containing protein n=1 Tax=Favolaschia claudopus TaxID=2862362 RepID=A0AAW0A2J3_9AGAR
MSISNILSSTVLYLRNRLADLNLRVHPQAPISLLPVELLVKIFLLCINVDSASNANYIKDGYMLSHVCSHWRNIWTGQLTLPMCFERKLEKEKEHLYAEGLRAWLSLSEPLLIPIRLEGFEFGTCFPQISPRILEELGKTTSRWRSLQIRQTIVNSFVKALASGNSFESLEELELENVMEDLSPDVTSIHSFSSAPLLRRLAINVDCRIPMPWAQLSDLTLSGPRRPFRSFLSKLYQCTSLVHASIILSALEHVPSFRPAPGLSFPHLKSLSLTLVGQYEREKLVMPFLDYINAPALESMSFSSETVDEALWDEAYFTTFQLRSPKITKLEISGNASRIHSAALISILTHSPLLTHLKLHDCLIQNTFLHALVVDDDNVSSAALVPRLSSLTLTGLADAGFSEDVLGTMIESRWAPGAPDGEMGSNRRLQTVVLGGESAFEGFRKAMEELQAIEIVGQSLA